MSVTVSSYQDPSILHLHPTISHVCNNCIWPFPMSLTVASNQQSYLYTCAYKHICLIHLHRTRINICYSNIQPSVLSVSLAMDQTSSNGFYNCNGQADLYQPAIKMVTNICSMHIPYSGVIFSVDTLHSIQLTFPLILIQKKVCTLIKHSVTKFSVISSVQYTLGLSFITSFFEEIFSQSRDFYENNMII